MPSFVGTISYGFAGVAFLVWALLLIPTLLSAPKSKWLFAVGLVSSAWAFTLAYGATGNRLPFLVGYVLELLRDGVWLTALAALAWRTVPRAFLWFLAAAWVLLFALGFLTIDANIAIMRLVGHGEILLARAGLLFSLLALILLEQVYRNTPLPMRNKLVYLILGVGGMFAYDLFLYSQAELLRGVDINAWNVRGLVCAGLTPMIVLAMRRNPDWAFEIFVSRQVVFYTGAVVSIGIYLLLMSIGGFYVRQIGGEWGRLGQLIFLSGAAVVLGMLLFSEALRRNVKVAIGKHFYRNKYDYRVEWLRFVSTLSGADEENVMRRSLKAVAQIFSCQEAVLYLRDDATPGYAPSAMWPLELELFSKLPRVPPRQSAPVFLATRQWVIDIAEWRERPDRYEGLELPDEWVTSRSFRIVSPILDRQQLVGFVLLSEPPPPFHLTYEDRDLLKMAGAHIATHILQLQADRKLAEGRQFEAYNQLTAFMMHDLKNSVAQLRLLVDNAARHKHKPEFIDDAVATIANAAVRIERLIEQLRGGDGAERNSLVHIDAVIQEAAARCGDRTPRPQVRGVTAARVLANANSLGAALEHVIRNAQDAAPEGIVVIDVVRGEKEVVASIKDDGCGMDVSFIRDRLFRPFDSTKGSRGMGIGAYQVRQYVRSLGGDVEVSSGLGAGTRFAIRLPVAPDSL